MTLTKGDLLKQVWEVCTFDEIINAGLESMKCNSSMIIDAAEEYTDPEKDLDEDEVCDIISKQDLEFAMNSLLTKYTMSDIIHFFEDNDVLNEFTFDDIEQYFSTDIYNRNNENYASGYEDGYDEGKSDMEKYYHERAYGLRCGSPDDKWKFLCDNFGIPYYYVDGLREKLSQMLDEIKNSTYNITKQTWQLQ